VIVFQGGKKELVPLLNAPAVIVFQGEEKEGLTPLLNAPAVIVFQGGKKEKEGENVAGRGGMV
jgi:hypothetical protein